MRLSAKSRVRPTTCGTCKCRCASTSDPKQDGPASLSRGAGLFHFRPPESVLWVLGLPEKISIKHYALLFLLLSAIYHSNLRPVASGDSLSASLVPFAVLLDHTVALDRFAPYIREHIWYNSSVIRQAGGHWYSPYPIAGPVLATPLYVPVVLVPGIGNLPPGTLITIARVAEKVAAATLAALAAVFLLSLLRRLTTERTAWLLTLVFALGTGNWSTASQALWQHTFGQLAIVGCLYAIERWSDASCWYWV